MRKYRHTTIVILCLLSGAAHGQFSEIWTNGDLFAVDQMASQCYSASVERCVAVGITPDSPSWFDYLLGKNRAKLLSVKENIKKCVSFPYIPRANVIDRIGTNYNYSVYFSGNAEFLTYCGLPTNCIDETPYFKSQYPETTGGWRNVMVMLTNLNIAADADPGFSWSSSEGYGDTSVYVTNTSMADAWAGASNGLVIAESSSETDVNVQTWIDGDGKYVAIIRVYNKLLSWKYGNYFGTVQVSTNFSFIGSVFYRATIPPFEGGDGGSYDQIFDPQLDLVTTNLSHRTSWTNAQGQASGPDFTISQNPNSVPVNYISTRGILGWSWDDFWGGEASMMVYDFNITNGFKYK
jgi:hypothetical protein